MNTLLNTILRSVIEAITEFLPISSTGHLYLFSSFFPFDNKEFDDLFDIFIQSGAILSVLVLYRKFLIEKISGTSKYIFQKKKIHYEDFQFFQFIFFGCLPILILGFLSRNFLNDLKNRSDLLLLLGFAWVVGGILIIIVEKYQKFVIKEESLNLKKSIFIGLFQCFALFPGVSRSAATIISARFLGIEKKKSAEYSFFLAIPVLILASLYKLFKHFSILDFNKALFLMIGFFLSFILCILVIKIFLKIIQVYSFEVFGYYRIILGSAVILGYYTIL